MRNFFKAAFIAVVSIALFPSFTVSGKTNVHTVNCGPGFLNFYNQSSLTVDRLSWEDPYGNSDTYLGLNIGPGDTYDLNPVTYPGGSAIGDYTFYIRMTTTGTGSLRVVDQSGTVVACVNLNPIKRLCAVTVNAGCASLYSVILTNNPC